jgi:hypothetical protein
MSDLPDQEPVDNPEVAHEESDVDTRAILKFGAALAVLALVVHVFLWWLQGTFAAQADRARTTVYPMAAGQQDQPPPEPRLQANPQQELRDLHSRQQSRLNGYSWVNKDGGIARIPIEEAMRIVVQRGLPVRPEPVAQSK